ncbi:MAG: tetratricopeptide repeat protein [Pseudomonadota bacterium]
MYSGCSFFILGSTVTIAWAGFDQGLAAYRAGDYTTAMKHWKPLAESGDAAAQYNLGVMYDNGQGVALDYKEAATWYRKAAEQGDADAQINLGLMYHNGQGVAQDYKEAAAWYRKAAEQGYAKAQNNLGVMYDNGQGVAQDYKEAVAWYRKAAEQGHAGAQFNLGLMYANGQGVLQDYLQAADFYQSAADQGHAGAMNNLGVLFRNGQGLPVSTVIAYALYNLSAALDSSSDNKAAGNRARLAEDMSTAEIVEAQALSRELNKPGNFSKGLIAYADKMAKRPKAAANPLPPAKTRETYPARPAKRPGVTSCNTRCVNADCWRTYDDGRKVRFQAKQKWNSFESRFEWDSGPC